MFERPNHRRIAQVLGALDGSKLRELRCWFGGGTAIALRHGEYRESVDIDFLVSDPVGYRQLRQQLAGATNIDALLRAGAASIALARDIRADQYGIRTALIVDGVRIKFEIVREARIALDEPARSDAVCGIAMLTTVDLAASKLLANSDRWRDDSAFSRDVIDLAMMDLPPRRLRRGCWRRSRGGTPAVAKAPAASPRQSRSSLVGVFARNWLWWLAAIASSMRRWNSYKGARPRQHDLHSLASCRICRISCERLMSS